MQKKVIVIGGGFAGLTSAAYLAKNKFQVTLLEASPKLGGRAYSFLDKENNTIIDNGQHILMGCYYETIKFLSLIKASNNFIFQKRLEVNFVQEGFQILPLKSFPFPHPLNLIFGLMTFGAINLADRVKLLKVFLKLPFYSTKNYSNLNIEEWILKEGQSQAVQDVFWKILAVGALNTSIEKASAKIFIETLKQIFLGGNKASILVLPKYGLSESYVNHAQQFTIQSGGDVCVSESVDKLKIQNSRIVELHTAKKVYSEFDFVVSAIPPYALSRLLGEIREPIIPGFNYSSILNIHVWLKKNILPDGFFGLINSPLHWVFNKGSHLNIVISDADELVNKSDEELIVIVKRELQKFFLSDSELISSYKIIKEKRATFIPSNDIIDKRPSQRTHINNLILAGDWVDTGLPSTIESAVKSGRVAAEIVMEMH
jgi:squalene-associated FAD-dependent desaturase